MYIRTSSFVSFETYPIFNKSVHQIFADINVKFVHISWKATNFGLNSFFLQNGNSFVQTSFCGLCESNCFANLFLVGNEITF